MMNMNGETVISEIDSHTDVNTINTLEGLWKHYILCDVDDHYAYELWDHKMIDIWARALEIISHHIEDDYDRKYLDKFTGNWK